MTQFTDLAAKATPAGGDIVPIRDVTSNTDKKTTVAGLATTVAASLPNNSIGAAALATSAISLGYTQVTANFSTSSSTPVQITGLTSTVTIPAGGRRIKITAVAGTIYNLSTNVAAFMTIWDGPVGSGTQLNIGRGFQSGSSGTTSITLMAVATPSAGSKTYNIGLNTGGSGTATVEANAAAPVFILVEVI